MTFPHIGYWKAATWTLATVAAAIIAIDPTVKIALIAGTPAAVTGLFGLLLGYLNRRELQNIKVNVDGRLSELLKVSGKAERMQGHVEGVEFEQQRMRPSDPGPPKENHD